MKKTTQPPTGAVTDLDPAPGSTPSGRLIGIRFIVTTAAVGILAVSVLLMAGIQERNTRKVLTHEIETRLLLEARNLALTSSSALLTEFPELVLHPMVKEMRAANENLDLVTVVDHAGLIQGHDDPRMLGQAYTPPEDLKPETSNLTLMPGESLVGNASLILAQAPVRHANGQVLGSASVGIQRDYLNAIITGARRQQLIFFAVVLILGLVATSLLLTSLLRPVKAIRGGLTRIGAGDLDVRLDVRDRTEFGMLAGTINQMTSQLKVAQQEMVEKERMTHELELAHQIQNSLIPAEGLDSGPFRIAGNHLAAGEVGGDYYDIFTLADGRVGVAVADVAGKGLGGCLVMSMLSALLAASKNNFDSPAELLAELDASLGAKLRSGTFVTMFYGILDPSDGKFVFASAGHSPCLVYRAASGTVETLSTKGIPLAAVRGGAIRRTLRDSELVLERGDMLLQYTDGINEAFDPEGKEQFGFERMERQLTEKAKAGVSEVISSMRASLEAWQAGGTRLDDETLLVVSRELPEVAESPKSAGQRSGTAVALEVVSGNPAAAEARPSGEARLKMTRVEGVESEDSAGAQPRDVAEALRWLEEARRIGERVTVPADMAAMGDLRAWVSLRAQIMSLEADKASLVVLAVYEACSNVAEHGYGLDPSQSMELWWVSDPELDLAGVADPAALPEGDVGYFLILDHGTPFGADTWSASDFSDPEVRRRGRGVGMDIIRGVMSPVAHYPATPEGNITRLGLSIEAFGNVQRRKRHA